MKPLCQLRFDGRSDCPCGENHEKLREYGRELKAAAARRSGGTVSGSEIAGKMLRAGVPAGLCAQLGQQRWQDTQALKAARDFVHSKAYPALYLTGAPGVGKSFAAAWCMFEFARTFPWDSQPSGYGVRPPMAYCDASEIAVSTLTSDALEAKLDQLTEARLAVIDDIPETGTPTGRQRLANVICARLDRQRATVVTGNLAPGVLGQEYGSRVEDRLRTAMRPKLETVSKRSNRDWKQVGQVAR